MTLLNAEDILLDIKTLSERSCLSVRTIKAYLHDPVKPMPAYRLKGKVLVRWPEFIEWLNENYRHEHPDVLQHKAKVAVESVLQKQ